MNQPAGSPPEDRAVYADELAAVIDRIAPAAERERLLALVDLAHGRKTRVVVQLRIDIADPSRLPQLEAAVCDAGKAFGVNLDSQSFVERPKVVSKVSRSAG